MALPTPAPETLPCPPQCHKGPDVAIPGYLTTDEMAGRLGVTPSRIFQLARKREVKPAMYIGRAALWHEADVERLRPGRGGWPKGRLRGPKPKDEPPAGQQPRNAT